MELLHNVINSHSSNQCLTLNQKSHLEKGNQQKTTLHSTVSFTLQFSLVVKR